MILDGTGISIELYTPIWRNDARRLITDNLGDLLVEFQKNEGVDGGYIDARCTAVTHEADMGVWLDRLGFDFQVFNESQQLIWNGFINQIQINSGAYSVVIGPLTNIANRVRVDYQAMSYNTNPPIGGGDASTAVGDDTDSQDAYGILEMHISGGQGLAADMTQLRDTYLAEYANPERGQQLNLDRPAPASVQIELLGYGALLGRFYFSQSGTSTQNASAKIAAILVAHPTVTFNTEGIEANTLQVPVFSLGDKSGLDELRDIVAKGDASDNRYSFGVYGGQAAVYQAIPTAPDEITYYHILSDSGQHIETAGNEEVLPWNLRAGRWLNVLDFVIGVNGTVGDLRQDLRSMYIESVQYTAPGTVTITGGKVAKLAQKLAKLGLGGI